MKRSWELSFEFFPPKTTAGDDNLKTTWQELAKLDPSYFSVTFGAGGSTQAKTQETITALRKDNLQATPHLTCIGTTKSSIKNLLAHYQQQGVKRIVALRGDLPQDNQRTDEFHHANELVSFIRETTHQHFQIKVAAYPEPHPETPDVLKDFLNFKRKVEAGADSAITQYFFNVDAYYRFMDLCLEHNITIPIIPGIMPIRDAEKLRRFSAMCGAIIPDWLDRKLDEYADDPASLIQYGIEVSTKLCQKLLAAGAPGLHFYTLNQSEPSLAIVNHLS